MATLIPPNQPGGFQDHPPARMLVRQSLLDTLRGVFERFGFVPLQTAAIQAREVLTGGQPASMRLYTVAAESVASQPDERDLALRFDLTVPLARFVAAEWDSLPQPFRRYEYGNVYRGERRQRGRYNEFAQFDVDVVAAASLVADAEILLMMAELMQSLDIEKFTIRVNNRKLLNALPAYAGFNEDLITDVLRFLDKVDKIGIEGVLVALGDQAADDEEGAALQPLGLPAGAIVKIRAFLAVAKGSPRGALGELKELFVDIPAGLAGLAELEEVFGYLEGQTERIIFDPTIVRGLGYYSGTVFETTLDELPDIGSVCSGGRYDGLVSRFSDRLKVPAIGTSVGVDRLVAALEILGKLPSRKTTAQVCIVRLMTKDGPLDRRLVRYAIGLAQELRQAEINTELYVGDEPTLKGQLAYVLNQEIPVAIVLGPDEQAAGKVTIKNIGAKEQVAVGRSEMVAVIQAILGLPLVGKPPVSEANCSTV